MSTLVLQSSSPSLNIDLPMVAEYVQRARTSGGKHPALIQNAVALAVINRLHQWCCQLFWLTIVCVIGCYGEDKDKTLKEVRRNISTSQRRSKIVSDLEMQLLRHLTCPQTAILRPIRRPISHKKRLSRPPSPQLFDISEEGDDLLD